MKKIPLLLISITLLTACYSNVEEVEELNENIENVETPSIKTSVEVSESVDVSESEANEYIYYKEVETDGKTASVGFLKELPASKVIEERPFDGCGDEGTYKVRPWFAPLSEQLKEISEKPEYAPLKGYGINRLCQSLDQKIVIGIYSQEYCGSGFVFRYDIEEDLVEVARFLDEYQIKCHETFHEFGKRNGGTIPVTGVFGDAGCKGEVEFDYDFTANTLKKRKICFGCINYSEMSEEEITDPNTEPVYDEECEYF